MKAKREKEKEYLIPPQYLVINKDFQGCTRPKLKAEVDLTTAGD